MSIAWSSDSFHLTRLLCVWLVLSHFACLYMHKIEVQALESMQRDEKTKQEKKMQTLKSVSCRQPTYVLSTTYFSHPLQFTWCFRWIFRGKLYIWDVCGVVFFHCVVFSCFTCKTKYGNALLLSQTWTPLCTKWFWILYFIFSEVIAVTVFFLFYSRNNSAGRKLRIVKKKHERKKSVRINLL